MLESFRANKYLKMCKLMKLPSSLSSSVSQVDSSLIPITSSLSDDDDDYCNNDDVYLQKVLVAIPSEPYSLFDLKTGYETLKRCKCRFNIYTNTNTTMDADTDTLRVAKPGLPNTMIDHIIEISILSASDRKIVVQHNAYEVIDGMNEYKMHPSHCENCDKTDCEYCDECYSCAECFSSLCKDCNNGYIEKCSRCNKMKCEGCSDYMTSCEKCEQLLCSPCIQEFKARCRFCDHNYFYCDKCALVVKCQTCDGIVCDECSTGLICDACKKASCDACINGGSRGVKVRHCRDPWCRKTLCSECETIKRCNLCHDSKCTKHLTACKTCTFVVCHFPCSCIECTDGVFCDKCKSYYCTKCTRNNIMYDQSTYKSLCLTCREN